MKNLNQKVFDILSGVAGGNVYYHYPAAFAKPPVVSYFETSNSGQVYADDGEYLAKAVYQVDVWAKQPGDMADISIKIDGGMKDAGFVRRSAGDLYDKDSGLYRKSMQFSKLI